MSAAIMGHSRSCFHCRTRSVSVLLWLSQMGLIRSPTTLNMADTTTESMISETFSSSLSYPSVMRIDGYSRKPIDDFAPPPGAGLSKDL
eukprot:scaffold10395_cov134-Skeletonema_dohrnii-CCMP3373.AAC.2